MLHCCTYPGCESKFNRPWKLRAHFNKHEDKKTHKCPIDGCDKAYFMSQHLQRHLSIFHEKRTQRTTCYGGGNFYKYLKAMAKSRFRCSKCKTVYDDAETYSQHSDVCTTYNCNLKQCVHTYSDYHSYRRHLLEDHHDIGSYDGEIFLCDKCPFACQRKFTIRVHVQRHLVCVCDRQECVGQLITAMETFHRCDCCEFTCRLPATLAKHRNQQHSLQHDQPRYTCDQDECDAVTFCRYVYYRRHLKSSHPPNYECDKCGNSSHERQQFISHVRTCYNLQSTTKQFRCLLCNREYRHKQNLNAHEKICVFNRRYICPTLTCLKEFRYLNSLKKHLILHKDNKIDSTHLKKKKIKIPYSRKLAIKLSADYTQK